MNILMVIDDFFPDVMGGAGRVVNEISKRLVKRGHSVYILTRRADRSLPLQTDIGGIRVHRYNVSFQNALVFSVSSLINAFWTFKKLSQEVAFDLINFHQPLSAFGVSLSMKAKGIPRVYTFYSSWPKEYEIRIAKRGIGFFMREWMERKILASCSKIIVLSEYSKKQVLAAYGFAKENIEIIPGGVDTLKFKPAQDKKSLKVKFNIPLNKFFLFTLRNLVPRMGLENLIEAMAIVVKENSQVILLIGGAGVLEEKLKRLVKDLQLEDYIKFTGFIEEDRLPLYYQAADLFILPTRELEGFGLVTLEALSCGTPVLGTPIGGTKEILGRLDGDLLFRNIDAASMAEKILLYLSSRDLLVLGKRCREFVMANFSWDSVAIEYERAFAQALNI
jgi:glycosyltransferase involved in cell wall biosynthesis